MAATTISERPGHDAVAGGRRRVLGAGRAADGPATRRFVLLGAVAFVAVTAGCVTAAPPAAGRWWLLAVLLAAAAAAWAYALIVRPADWRTALACYLTFGLAGCGVDLVQPVGPAFVFGYMALAGMGLALPRWPAIVGGAVLLAALGVTEAATSDHPGAAALAVALGAGFLFVAAQFAAMTRDAHRRSGEILARVQGERAAREEAAALAERSRLARDLHDVLAHTLSGLALQLEATRLLAVRSGADPALVEQVTLAQKLARQGMTGAKQAIAALRGADMPGLADLPQLVDEFRRSTGMFARLTVRGTPWTPTPAQQLAAYRMVQEALSNVAKHEAGAPDVAARVEWTDEALRIEVSNTRAPAAGSAGSPGPASDPTAATGFGLTGIAERAAMLGAVVSAGPTPEGFTVAWELPRRHQASAAAVPAAGPERPDAGGAG